MTTKHDLARFDKLVQHGCICCKLMGIYSVPEIHHIVDKGYRKHSGGHSATLPLCPWHHRGMVVYAIHTWDMGPSLAHGSKPFHARFGTQRELLEMVDANIGELA